MAFKDIQNIIWDWNGTLLNDVELCCETLNVLLEERRLKPVTMDIYKNNFTFPVYGFYEFLGFNFQNEDFSKVSLQYMSTYNDGLKKSGLSLLAVYALKAMKRRGIMQYVLSAMEQGDLNRSLTLKGIKHYFTKVYGSANQNAEGKLSVARKMFQEEQLAPKDTLIVGDTLHDAEVAAAVGCHVILVTNGHQSREKLIQSGVNTVADLGDLIERYFLR